jgi:hypothetical protein
VTSNSLIIRFSKLITTFERPVYLVPLEKDSSAAVVHWSPWQLLHLGWGSNLALDQDI